VLLLRNFPAKPFLMQLRLLLSFFLILIFSNISAQENTSKEDRINTVIELVYSIEGFQQRFGNTLDNNPLFIQEAENEALIALLTENVRLTAVDAYATSIRQSLNDNFTDEELGRLIESFQGADSVLLKRLFITDNQEVEKALGQYVNQQLETAATELQKQDSLLFVMDYPMDLAKIMDGNYVDSLPTGEVINVTRSKNEQIESYLGESYRLEIDWRSNNSYALYAHEENESILDNDTVYVNIYEVEGNRFNFIVKMPDGSYEKSSLTRTSPYTLVQEIELFQHQLTVDYGSEENSPLKPEQRTLFAQLGGHPFFPIDLNYRVTADLEVYDDPEQIQFKTSTARMANYQVYGKATFKLGRKAVELFVYQSTNPAYSDHLFLPFKDLTAGKETYGGGRYLDITIPEDSTKLVIDFNRAYQPYCAYTYGYSCPVVPQENYVNQRIEAGVIHLDLKGEE
jgi:hypothetical protein